MFSMRVRHCVSSNPGDPRKKAAILAERAGRDTQACRAFIYRTAQQADAGKADRKDCAAVILYAAEAATRMALDAIQVCLKLRLWSNPGLSLGSGWVCFAVCFEEDLQQPRCA